MIRSGFTLLELLLATMLSAMLMVGVMAVVVDIGRTSQALKTTTSAQPDDASTIDEQAMTNWITLLRADLEQSAGRIDTSVGRLEMIGFHAISSSGPAEHYPVSISYYIKQVGNDSWVIREQKRLDVLSNQNINRELVCRGVSKFILAAEESQITKAARTTGKSSARAGASIGSRRTGSSGAQANAAGEQNAATLEPYVPFHMVYPFALQATAEDLAWLRTHKPGDPFSDPPANQGDPARGAGGVGSTASGSAAAAPADPQRIVIPAYAWRLAVWSGTDGPVSVDRFVRIR